MLEGRFAFVGHIRKAGRTDRWQRDGWCAVVLHAALKLPGESGDHDPSMPDEEIGAGDGVYLPYSWPYHELALIEVFGFSKRYGSLPVSIHLHTPEMMTIQLPRELVVAYSH